MTTKAQIESLLFVAGEEGISLDELSYLLTENTATIYAELAQLREDYIANQNTALTLLEVGERFLLTTKKEYAEIIKNYAQSPLSNHLSQAALETLSIIAYKQPITRMEIEEIRGVQSSGSVQKLVSRQLIESKGRVDGPGRAKLYGTSAYFMDYFGLKNLTELPDISEMEATLENEAPSDLFFDRFQAELNPTEETKTNENVKDE